MKKTYNEYLNDATDVCIKKWGSMTSEFIKADKEAIAQGLMMNERFLELERIQSETLDVLNLILAEIKKEPVKKTTAKK